MRTPQEILDQTNELAREFYRIRGYQVDEGYKFHEATHPHEVQAWYMACAAQSLLTSTSLDDIFDELDLPRKRYDLIHY